MAGNNVLVDEVSQAHIPVSIRDPVLIMSAECAYTGVLPTVFVGIVDERYTEEMWNSHALRLAELFNVQETGVKEVKIRRIGINTIDGEQLGRDMTSAINFLNEQSVQSGVVNKIRIVGMGIHSAIAVLDALEGLVQGWNQPWDQKKIQFVALGDSKESDYLNLCKRMCLKKICYAVQFYTTMDYTTVGFLDLARGKIQRIDPEILAKLIDPDMLAKLEANQNL
jgi:hypothetical protein